MSDVRVYKAPDSNRAKQVVPDNDKGISQENLEGLRAEFVSVGGVVSSLPNPKSVRDFTIVVIPSKNHKEGHYERWQMINGLWCFIGLALPSYPHHISGSLDQRDSSQTITVSAIDTLTPVVDGWTTTHLDNVSVKNGLFLIEAKVEYIFQWNLSFTASSANQLFEGVIIVNGVDVASGSARQKIGTASDATSMGSQGIFDLGIGDTIGLAIYNRTSGADLTVEHANLSIRGQ